MDTVDFLSTVPLLRGVGREDLARFAELTRTRKCARGSVILSVNDPGNSLFIVREGRVKIVLSDAGREIILGILGPGSHFGELALIDGEPRSANVVAMDETELIVLMREDFQRRVQESPALAWALLLELSHRLRKADSQIGSLALLDVEGRMARLFLDSADEGGAPMIKKRLTHQVIAQMIGASRETVSRAMTEFQNRGLITVDRRQITITDRQRLEAMAQIRV